MTPKIRFNPSASSASQAAEQNAVHHRFQQVDVEKSIIVAT
jgi:hypothetical protein